jgi:preprotein translocase subunit SecG
MIIILFVVHVLIAFALVGVVLLQKSEGGALGIGGGGMSGFMTGRSTANLLTRTTAILAAVFFATSLSLVILSNRSHAPRSILDQNYPAGPTAPSPPSSTGPVPPKPAAPAPAKPAVPAKPAGPSVPLAR